MKNWTINDRTGAVLHEGQDETKKALIQRLVLEGRSLAGADLRNLDLSHLDLTGVDLAGADLSGASLRGAKAKGARFDGAVLDGVRAEGMTAVGASFMHATIGLHKRRGQDLKATFDGAVLTHARFDAAVINEASFEGCSISGGSFCLATVVRGVFRDARLNNLDWSQARLLHCDLRDAEMHATTAAYRIPRSSLPNRSRDTIAVGNNLEGAITDDTIPAFRRDRVLSGIDTHLAWTVSTAAMLAGASLLPVDPSGDWLGKLVGQGTVLIGALTLIGLLKEKITEKVQEHLSDATLKAQMAARTALFDLVRRAGNVANSVVALSRGPGAGAILDAMRATADDREAKGRVAAFAHAVIGDVDVVICDKGRMARGLEWISMAFSRSHLLGRDLVVARSDAGPDAPSLLKFFAHGGMAAFWTEKGKVVRAMSWGADDMAPEIVEGDADAPVSAIEARLAFERAVVDEHVPGVHLDYDPAQQQLRAGRDGSVVVTEMRNQLPRNRHGSVLIRPDGGAYSESGARDLLRRENDEPDDPEAVPLRI